MNENLGSPERSEFDSVSLTEVEEALESDNNALTFKMNGNHDNNINFESEINNNPQFINIKLNKRKTFL